MNNYEPDLELRLAVAEDFYEGCDCWIEQNTVFIRDRDSHVCVECLHFDESFDAILPLVRGLNDTEFMALMRELLRICITYHRNKDYFHIYLTKDATPADYCRAYLAAKGEKE